MEDLQEEVHKLKGFEEKLKRTTAKYKASNEQIESLQRQTVEVAQEKQKINDEIV